MGKTTFQSDWIDSQIHPEWTSWLRPVNGDSHRAFCKACSKSFDVGNMGRSAVSSHAKQSGHNTKLKNMMKSPFFRQREFVCQQPTSDQSTNQQSTASSQQSTACSQQSTASGRHITKDQEMVDDPQASNSLASSNASVSALDKWRKSAAHKFEVTKAEIIWAMDSVKKHRSHHSSDDQGDIFRAMFSDSRIAEDYSMAEDKLAYTIAFGLAPYFHKETLTRVKRASEFAISFDEAHNKVIHKGQFDLWIRYFDDVSNQVKSEYFTSIFLGHSRSSDLMKSVIEGTSGMDLKFLVQISMDGPAVNLSFMRVFLKEFEAKFDKSLLETGVCSLHVVSGAIKHGHKASDWKVEAFLKALYELWKRSPARRAEYTTITGSNNFPKKFCATRWTENVGACQRAIEIFPHVKKFCTHVKPKPNIQAFDTVQKTITDPFSEAKLHFFRTIADDFEPFLRRFQNDRPMFPFLYSFLLSLLNGVLKRFVKPEVLTDAGANFVRLKALDLKSDENLKMATQTDVGFGAKRAIPTNPKPMEKLNFYRQCQAFLCGVAQKIIERSPLQHPLVRGASALSPSTICDNTRIVCEKRFDIVLNSFLDKKLISVSEADSAKSEYADFISNSNVRTRLERYDLNEDRLDDLYVNLIKTNHNWNFLWLIVRRLLILFHGQAAVESGFSINKDLLLENMSETSVIAQRVVYNAVKNGVLQSPITTEMVESVRYASKRRRLHLIEQREKENKEKEAKKRKNELDIELQSIEHESARLQDHIKELNEKATALKAAKLQL